jgi:hypothetical protein
MPFINEKNEVIELGDLRYINLEVVIEELTGLQNKVQELETKLARLAQLVGATV